MLKPVCSYCERTADEVVAETEAARLLAVSLEEALKYVLVGNNRVLLCPDDRGDRVPLTEKEMWELLEAPMDLPPGITALRHNCPMLEYDYGEASEETTFMVELVADDQHPGYLVGHCGECGMNVRSPIVVNDHTEAEPREGGAEQEG